MNSLKYWDGANPKIYAIATQTDDGRWHLACHWTDRILEYECELIEDSTGQQLRYGHGSILPLRNSKGLLHSRWSEATEQDINDRPAPKETQPAEEALPAEEPQSAEEVLPAEEPQPTRYDVIAESRVNNTRPQAAAAKPEPSAAKHEPSAAKPEPSAAKTSGHGHQILKAVGYVAAMSVVLVVIWETGLIIPLGLIGLATSGILK